MATARCCTVQYVPEWFPGAGFKATARKWNEEVMEMVNRPHLWAKEQIVCYLIIFKSRFLLKSSKAAGIAPKSFVSTLLDVPSLTEEEDHAIKWSAASFYGGASLLSPCFFSFTILTLHQAVPTQ